MQLSGANELLYAAKASYLYKAIKTKELVDSLKQPTLEKISKKLNIPINEINYQKIQDNITNGKCAQIKDKLNGFNS